MLSTLEMVLTQYLEHYISAIIIIIIFITKAFNLDCLYITYIITSVMIRVISVAVNISMSARKLFRNDLNFKFPLGCLILVLSCSEYFFCFAIELPNLAMFSEH